MNNRINEIWSALGKATAVTDGIARIRYSATSAAALYIGYKTPELFPAFSLSVPRRYLTKPVSAPVYRNLRLDNTDDEINQDNVFFNLLLTDTALSSVFNILISDFIHHLENVADPEKQVKVFFDHLIKWQKLFDDIPAGHLAPEAQRGLFAELIFLQKWLTKGAPMVSCVNAWLGPDKAAHDFKTGMYAIEVKSTLLTSHQKIQISSEYQLDESGLDDLFLFCLSMDERKGGGQTLPELVGVLKDQLNDDFNALRLFNLKLAAAGWYDHHTSNYVNTGWLISTETFYKVADDFPRIRKSDIRPGTGNVKYTVSKDMLTSFEITDDSVFSKITNLTHG